jgi:hypothetical protein
MSPKLFNNFLIKGDLVFKLILANEFTLSWGFLSTLKFDVGGITIRTIQQPHIMDFNSNMKLMPSRLKQ